MPGQEGPTSSFMRLGSACRSASPLRIPCASAPLFVCALGVHVARTELPSIMTTPSLVVTGPYSLAEAERYLRETVVPLRLACTTSAGWPLVLSLWYLYRDGALWCATSPAALILRHLDHDDRCGFEVAPNEPPYRGVRGQARATVIRGGGGSLLAELIQR